MARNLIRDLVLYLYGHIYHDCTFRGCTTACPLHWHNFKNSHFAVCAVWTAHRVAHMWAKVFLTFQQRFHVNFLFQNTAKQTENGFTQLNNVIYRGWHVKGCYIYEDNGDRYLKKRPDTAHNTTDLYVTSYAQKQAGTSKLASRFYRGWAGEVHTADGGKVLGVDV